MSSSERARYVAIITDGNGRWAQSRGRPVLEGHEAGADVVKARLRDAVDVVDRVRADAEVIEGPARRRIAA